MIPFSEYPPEAKKKARPWLILAIFLFAIAAVCFIIGYFGRGLLSILALVNAIVMLLLSIRCFNKSQSFVAIEDDDEEDEEKEDSEEA